MAIFSGCAGAASAVPGQPRLRPSARLAGLRAHDGDVEDVGHAGAFLVHVGGHALIGEGGRQDIAGKESTRGIEQLAHGVDRVAASSDGPGMRAAVGEEAGQGEVERRQVIAGEVLVVGFEQVVLGAEEGAADARARYAAAGGCATSGAAWPASRAGGTSLSLGIMVASFAAVLGPLLFHEAQALGVHFLGAGEEIAPDLGGRRQVGQGRPKASITIQPS